MWCWASADWKATRPIPNSYLGAVVGRYGNRIALGKFTLDGKTYQIPVNNGANALHGGPMGFDQYVWQAKEVPDGVEFTHVSPDGDMGFPGTLTATVRYTLKGNTLRIDYTANTDKDTVVNLTNHSYFNLHGDDKGNILDQRIEINADRYTPVDAGLIPTGELAPVAGTPMDFRKPEAIGARIDADNEQLKRAGGYDFNFVLNGKPGTLRLAAIVTDPVSGRKLTVETTEPGVQFYSGNFLDGSLTGMERREVREARRILPGDAAFSGFAEPSGFPEHGAEAGRDHALDHDVHIWSGEVATSVRRSPDRLYCGAHAADAS